MNIQVNMFSWNIESTAHATCTKCTPAYLSLISAPCWPALLAAERAALTASLAFPWHSQGTGGTSSSQHLNCISREIYNSRVGLGAQGKEKECLPGAQLCSVPGAQLHPRGTVLYHPRDTAPLQAIPSLDSQRAALLPGAQLCSIPEAQPHPRGHNFTPGHPFP